MKPWSYIWLEFGLFSTIIYIYICMLHFSLPCSVHVHEKSHYNESLYNRTRLCFLRLYCTEVLQPPRVSEDTVTTYEIQIWLLDFIIREKTARYFSAWPCWAEAALRNDIVISSLLIDRQLNTRITAWPKLGIHTNEARDDLAHGYRLHRQSFHCSECVFFSRWDRIPTLSRPVRQLTRKFAVSTDDKLRGLRVYS